GGVRGGPCPAGAATGGPRRAEGLSMRPPVSVLPSAGVDLVQLVGAHDVPCHALADAAIDTVHAKRLTHFLLLRSRVGAVTDTFRTSLRGSWFNADTQRLGSAHETLDLGLRQLLGSRI